MKKRKKIDSLLDRGYETKAYYEKLRYECDKLRNKNEAIIFNFYRIIKSEDENKCILIMSKIKEVYGYEMLEKIFTTRFKDYHEDSKTQLYDYYECGKTLLYVAIKEKKYALAKQMFEFCAKHCPESNRSSLRRYLYDFESKKHAMSTLLFLMICFSIIGVTYGILLKYKLGNNVIFGYIYGAVNITAFIGSAIIYKYAEGVFDERKICQLDSKMCGVISNSEKGNSNTDNWCAKLIKELKSHESSTFLDDNLLDLDRVAVEQVVAQLNKLQ